MSECPTLETDRLRLRPFVDDDVEAYFALYDTPEVRRSLHVAGLVLTRRRLDPPCPLARPMGAARHGPVGARASRHRGVHRTSRLAPPRTSRLAGSGDRLDTPSRPLGPRLRHRGRPGRGRLVFREPRRRRTRERDPAREHGEPGRGSPPRLRVVRGADPAALSPATPRDLAACEAGDGRRPLSLRPVGDFARC